MLGNDENHASYERNKNALKRGHAERGIENTYVEKVQKRVRSRLAEITTFVL